jgi:hypothetical protein
MNRSVLLRLSLITATILLSACGANHHSIFRHQKLDPTQSAVITIDAKQRAILVGTEETTTGVGETQQTKSKIRQFCSEPSPDVFSVVAQALSAGGTFGKSADPRAVEVALNAAFSSAEQGSTIPRTQTVNMLRELMFRTCERYLNGGISSLELPIQAARDQRLMVSILAIESLTGAVTPKPVVIGAGANASGGASGAEAAVRLDDAHKALQAKTAAQQSRQNEYNEITTDKKHCEQIAEAVAKKEEDKLPQELKDKRAKCETATSALAAAKKETASSAAHYATLKDTAASGGIPVATTAAVMTPKADGGLDRAHSEAIRDVSGAVERIVMKNMDQDEFLFLCLKVLSNDPGERKKASQDLVQGTRDTCIAYVKAGIELEEARKKHDAVAIYRARSAALFENFWKKMSKDGKTADASAVKAGQARFGASWPGCFTSGASREVFDRCFHGKDVTSQDQRNFEAMGEGE